MGARVCTLRLEQQGYRRRRDIRRQPLCLAGTAVGAGGGRRLQMSGVQPSTTQITIILPEVCHASNKCRPAELLLT